METADKNIKPECDKVIQEIADYVLASNEFSDEAYETAKYCLFDSIACAIQALDYQACHIHLGPLVEGAELEKGTRVIGTTYKLDPVQGAFNITCLIRWLDYNDTWLAAEWGHPSDNFGAIIAIADYLNRNGKAKYTVKDILYAAIQAYEIQGIIALENSFNKRGLDHVLLVRVASAAVVTRMLGGGRDEVISAVSNAWADGGALRTYRHAPNTNNRKSWAAGDACSRGVRIALYAIRDPKIIPSVLTEPKWGYEARLMGGGKIKLGRKLEDYVMRNILFKVSYPAEFHAQTAVEAAIKLHNSIPSIDSIKEIRIWTQWSGAEIISKTGPLHNPADRDHCIQYMVAIALLHGDLRAEHYEDDVAGDPKVDLLRSKMKVEEDKSYSKDYLDPDKRSIANAIQITYKDGKTSERVEVNYPIGHRIRRKESKPLLEEKYSRAIEASKNINNKKELLLLLQNDELDEIQIDKFWSGYANGGH